MRYEFPVGIGYTDFDLGEGIPLDRLTTLSVVPTAEFVRPLGSDWTLLPFVGVGGGWLIDDAQGVAILSTGVKAEWSPHVDGLSLLRVAPRIRYDANLNRPDGLLGDWGRIDLALELRRSFRLDDELRFAPGVYGQWFWFWNDIDFELPGSTPASADNQQEFGFSLGTVEPLRVFGVTLPRMFVGYRFGDGVDTWSLRFGEL